MARIALREDLASDFDSLNAEREARLTARAEDFEALRTDCAAPCISPYVGVACPSIGNRCSIAAIPVTMTRPSDTATNGAEHATDRTLLRNRFMGVLVCIETVYLKCCLGAISVVYGGIELRNEVSSKCRFQGLSKNLS